MAKINEQHNPNTSKRAIASHHVNVTNKGMPAKVTYRAGPEKGERTKRNQLQKHNIIYMRPKIENNITTTLQIPMPYVHLSMFKNKRINIKSLIRKKITNLHTDLYSNYINSNDNHSQYNYCRKQQTSKAKPTNSMPSKVTSSKAKSPYQEMLQRGIDGYMNEKQPDSVIAANNSNNIPGDATPPLSN